MLSREKFVNYVLLQLWINKWCNIYYVSVTRANWLHSFQHFLTFFFGIGNSSFFDIKKFPTLLNPSWLITPYEIFLSFFLSFKNFWQIFKIFLHRRIFREIVRSVFTRYEAWFFPESDRKVVSWNRIDWSAIGWWNSDSFLRRIAYDTFPRWTLEKYSILATRLLNLFTVIS